MPNVRGRRENQKVSSRESLEKFHKVELAAKRRERIAQGVSPGSGINLGQSPEGATDLCRPLGAFSQLALIPRANALGYALSPLRGCLTGIILR